MVRTSLGSISLALTALSLAGCGSLGPATHHARLADGAGIAAQSPVLVAGVRVGQVQSIQVVDGVVDVAFTFEGDHEIVLRADACAAVARGGLMIVPGEGAPRTDDQPLAQCETGSAALDELMRTAAQGMDIWMRAIEQRTRPEQPAAPPPP